MTSYTPVQLAFSFVELEGCSEEKAPILFLHGLTACKEYWDDIPQIVADATKRKVFLLDSRNHGDSGWSDVFNFDCNADDLLNFMDSMLLPKAIIVGHSMGGMAGIKTALRAPERVERLVVEDMSVKKIPQQRLDLVANYLSLAKAALEKVPDDVDEETAKRMILDDVYEHLPPEIKEHTTRNSNSYRIQLRRTPDGRFAFKTNIDALAKAMKNTEDLMVPPSGVYGGPTCFIYGKLSPLQVGADEALIKEFFPNAEFTGIENANHSVHSEHPREFTEALLNFLKAE